MYTLESGHVVSVGKECRQTRLSVHHVKGGLTSGVEGYVMTVTGSRWYNPRSSSS